MKIGTKFVFTEKPDLGIYNEELSGVTIGKVYEISKICVTGSSLFIDDEGQENYAAGSDGMLKDYVEIHSLPKGPDVHGYVIVNKETGGRWGGLYNSSRGAVSSWNTHRGIQDYDLFERKISFNEQDVYTIKSLVIYDVE